MGARAGEEKTIFSSLINPLRSQLVSETFEAVMRMDALMRISSNILKKTQTKIIHLLNGKITSRFLSGLDWF